MNHNETNTRRSVVGLHVMRATLVAAVCAVAVPDVSLGAWFNTVWKSRQKITVSSNKVVGTHSDFPLLVSITNGNPVFLKAKSGGGDILFTKADGTTQVPFEKEEYDPASNTLTYWVKLDSLSSAQDACVYIYYNSGSNATGNTATDVWTNDFVMVQHMQESADDASPAFKDSTVNGNDGTDFNMDSANRVAGKIGDAQDFDGVNGAGGDRIEVPSNSTLDVTGALTLSFWAKGTPYNDGILWRRTGNTGYSLHSEAFGPGDDRFNARHGHGASFSVATGSTQTDDDIWQYVAGVFVPSTRLSLYVDGVLEAEDTTSVGATIAVPDIDLFIGSRDAPTWNYDGIIDEATISDVARSANWIATTYSNQVAPDAFLALSAEENQSTAWYDTDWLNRRKITIASNNVCGTHFNFPLLVSITNNNSVFSKAKSTGGDILFTRADGTTKIAYEKEKYDAVSTQLVYWVLMNGISSNQDVCIYMYYNSASDDTGNVTTDVWTNDFVLVQHLQESADDASPAFKDSTANSNDGTDFNMSSANRVAGKIGDAQDFDGVNTASGDHIEVPSNSTLDVTGAMTISFWAKGTPYNDGIVWRFDPANNGYMLHSEAFGPGDDRFKVRFGDGVAGYPAATGTIQTDDDIWQYVAGVFVPSTAARLYVDAVLDAEDTTDVGPFITVPGTDLFIGARSATTWKYDGIIDEARISDVARSLCWIKTTYDNQVSPQTFSTLGSEEDAPPTGTVIYMK